MLTKEQIAKLQAFADSKTGDPALDKMKAAVAKQLLREKLG